MIPGAKIAGAAALAAAVFFGLWQMERATVAGLRGQVDGLKVSLATETSRAEAAERNSDRMTSMAEHSLDMASGLQDRLDASNTLTLEHVAEIEVLKAKELQHAIEEPIARGNAASDRIHRSMCRAVGSKTGSCAGLDIPASDAADHQE